MKKCKLLNPKDWEAYRHSLRCLGWLLLVEKRALAKSIFNDNSGKKKPKLVVDNFDLVLIAFFLLKNGMKWLLSNE